MNTGQAGALVLSRIVKNNSVSFHLSTEFSRLYIRRPLVLLYPPEVDLGNLPASVVDIPLITNVIPVVWFSGKTYEIEEMDEDLYYSLEKIKEFFKRFFYNTSWEGELRPSRLVKNTILSTGKSAALFTGGLDSTTTVLRHFDENPTLISFNTIHDLAVDFAKRHHFDHDTIHFNYYDFLKLSRLDRASIDITKWFWDTTMGLAWVGVTAPLLYAKGITQLYIPSGFTWQSFIFPDGQTMMQPATPLIDENLSPFGLGVSHDVFTMTRTDKIERISHICAERGIPLPQLVVCNSHQRANTAYVSCNKCMKCLITMLDIFATGQQLKDYGFTISEEEFIARFKDYVEKLTMRRGGTYTALSDTQRYLKKNIEKLPRNRRAFYTWFMSLDLWGMVEESSSRPPRSVPFKWEDYADLYPGMAEWVDSKS